METEASVRAENTHGLLNDLIQTYCYEEEAGTISVDEGLSILKAKLDAHNKMNAEIANLRQKLAEMTVERAMVLKNEISLRKEVADAWDASEPNTLQLKKILLEPAVNREFLRLSSLAKSASTDAASLREELRAIHFVANDPKGPRAMAAKVRSLEDKCKSMSTEASESKVRALKLSLSLAQNQLEKMREQYGELEDHVATLHDEIDELQKDLLNTRHLRERGEKGSTEGHHSRGGGNEKNDNSARFERRRSLGPTVPLKKKSRMLQ